MSRTSGIIAFQTKKSNLERDLRKETDIKSVTKGNRKIPHTLFWVFYQILASRRLLVWVPYGQITTSENNLQSAVCKFHEMSYTDLRPGN